MIARSVALLVLWVALWGEVSVANVASGVVVIAVLSWAFPGPRSSTHRVRPVAALRLAGHVLVSLVTSTWQVVLAVLRPTPDRTNAEVLEVSLTTRAPLVASLVANAITLTPGTMSVELDRGSYVLHVHVLGRVDPEAFRGDVLHLESLVAAALPERGAR